MCPVSRDISEQERTVTDSADVILLQLAAPRWGSETRSKLERRARVPVGRVQVK